MGEGANPKQPEPLPKKRKNGRKKKDLGTTPSQSNRYLSDKPKTDARVTGRGKATAGGYLCNSKGNRKKELGKRGEKTGIEENEGFLLNLTRNSFKKDAYLHNTE